MPDLLEPPAKYRPRLPHAFTPENARTMALRSVKARLQRIAKANAVPKPVTLATPDERLILLEEQIARTRMTLNGKLEPQHRAALLRALCDLLDQQRIARGEPLPGSRKPLPERRGGSEDRPLSPKPACGPDTPTGCVNPQVQVNEKPQEHSS